MIIKTETRLIDSGPFSGTNEFEERLEEVRAAIRCVVWPPNSTLFTLNPEPEGNGVVPIKSLFQKSLVAHHWGLEQKVRLAAREKPGDLDAAILLTDGTMFAAEWETGNISSSHRSVNRMLLGLMETTLRVGVLIVPSRDMYQYLTDRVGNLKELEPYFPIWRSIRIANGVLMVIEIEHDALSSKVELIPKNQDGNAFRKKLLGDKVSRTYPLQHPLPL